MSATSGTHEDPDGIEVKAVDSIDGPWFRSTASARAQSEREQPPDYHRRVRVAALAAEVEALEAEVEALERAVESKERQRQQVIDTYETIVEERSEPERGSETGPDASNESKGWRPLGAVASWVERAAARLRRPNE